MTFDRNPKPVQFIQPNALDRTMALPINSDCAAPYSFKIVDARRSTDGMLVHCLAEPSALSKAAQPKRAFLP
jgi:hypothetical protein